MYYSQVLEAVQAHLEGPRGEVKAECTQRVGLDLQSMPELVSMCRVPRGSLAKARCINSNKKSWDFGKLSGRFYLRGS